LPVFSSPVSWYSLPIVRWYRSILGGALGGIGSGLLGTLLEVSAFPPSDLSRQLVLAVGGTIVPAFLAVGLSLGVLLAGVLAAGRVLARLLRSRRELALAGVVAGALTVFPLLVLLAEMAKGHKAGTFLGATAVRVGLALLGAALFGLCTWLGFLWGRRIAESRGRALPLFLAVLFLTAAVLLFRADAGLYQRLYAYLHLTLLVGYQAAGLLSTLCLWRGLSPREVRPRVLPPWLRRASVLALVASLAAAGLWSRRTLIQDQHLRYCALELSVVSAQLLSLMPLKVRRESPLFLDIRMPKVSRSKGGYRVPEANVILVSIDALRPDHLGAYGYQRATSPNIDALAGRSIRFENAYCQVPLTCYSVPSLHTGDYLRSTLPLLDRPPPTLARILSGRGYTTAAFYNASMFFCDDQRAMSYGDARFGFGYAETALRPASALTDQVLDYLETFHRSGKRKLFLWVHYFDVHEPYEAHPEFAFGNQTVDRYDSELAYVDAAVGRLVAAASELAGPTLFILTADHGEEFKEHGGYYHGSSLYDEQVRVPLVIGVPGLKPRTVKASAQLVDVVPTILTLLGERVPESVHGRSLVSALVGPGEQEPVAFSEIHTKKMVRHRDWKLIHDYRRGTCELYDLETDPREHTNLIARRPVEADRLRLLLNRWFDQVRAVASAREKDRPEAIDLGRIGDRRALPLLAQLVANSRAASKWRQEAARLLGQMQEPTVAEALWMGAADDDDDVAAEAAIALGEVKDTRARIVLPRVLATADLSRRMRAGIALGRVDGREAVPALELGLYSDNWEVQNRAAHYLGFVGDRGAIDPLLNAASHLYLRGRVALALGRIGTRVKDKRILAVLLDWVQRDPHAEVRQRALAGLGFLGDRRAVRPLASLLAEEQDLIWVAETLGRLSAIGSWWVPGLDVTPARRGLKEGWGGCVNNATIVSDDYRESSWCVTSATAASVQFNQQRKPFAGELVLRVQPLDPQVAQSDLLIAVNGKVLRATRLLKGWQSIRLHTEARQWKQGRNQVRLQLAPPTGWSGVPPKELLAVDYLLLIPDNGGTRGARRGK
jgi:arylsulfatase A-like enzyme/HEAT repeat protein